MKSSAAPLQPLRYSALEAVRVPRPVDRLGFIAAQVRGKAVFDLGALDETALDAKMGTSDWLHARLCESASSVIGIDNSKLLPAEGLATINGGRIIHADIFDLAPVIEQHGRPDVIVAGELIEHLPNTLELLSRLRANRTLRGVDLVISTPNACSWHNILIGLAGRESTHCDHLQIYSYKTLRTLFSRAGIDLVSVVPYHVRFQEMIAGSRGFGRVAVRLFEKGVNALEWAAPILSAGWIVTARI